MAAILLRNVRPLGGPATDVLVQDGRIRALGAGLEAPDARPHDGGGALLLPGLIEGHTHLDKTLLGLPWRPHGAGPSVLDKIENERRLRRELRLDAAAQAANQLERLVTAGTTHVRTHVDIDTEIGLAHVEALLAVREAWRPLIDVEIVAFPQSGLLIRPGTLDLVREALVLGADLVGGLDPSAIDRDPKGHLDAVFGIAERHGKGIDIHLHEPNELGALTLELCCERIAALDMVGRVAISHAFCLGMADDAYVGRLIDDLARHDVAIVTTAPAGRPAPDPKRLAAAGVRVAGGSDGFRDAWTPYGTTDMLERACLIGQRWNWRRDEDIALALDLMTGKAAAVLGLEHYGVAVGDAADLVLVRAETVAEAVVSRPARILVLKGGRIVAENGALTGAPD
jgi:cytosine deaminase